MAVFIERAAYRRHSVSVSAWHVAFVGDRLIGRAAQALFDDAVTGMTLKNIDTQKPSSLSV